MGISEEVFERLATVEEGQEWIKRELTHIKKVVEKKSPGGYYQIVITVLLLGVFSWLAVLTKIIAGG